MGFIQDNTNTLEVYLTDLGRQKFFQGGLKNAIVYFSLTDGDTNYDVFQPDPTEVLPYNFFSLSGYTPGVAVQNGGVYYRFKMGSGARSAPPSDWWDKLNVFNPTIITAQPLPIINHDGVLQTSLGDGSDAFVNDVFTQVSLRGSIIDGATPNKTLKAVKTNTYKSYVFREPDPSTTGTTITTTYITR